MSGFLGTVLARPRMYPRRAGSAEAPGLHGDSIIYMCLSAEGQEPMTGELAPIVESAERLCRTLERIGDALSALDVDTLLETEETLGCLLAAIRHKGLVEDRAAFESLVERGRAGRLRCRRLAFTTASRSRLSVHTGIEADDLDSEHLRGAVSGPSIEAT